MIKYKTFTPQVVEEGFLSKKYEAFSLTVERTNSWIKANNIQPLNIETVLLPNPEDPEKNGFAVGEISVWYQFIRVWYKASA